METASELNEQLMECIFRLFALLRRGPRMPAGEPGSKVGGRPSAQNRILLMLNESDGISQRDMTTLLQLRPQSRSETRSTLEELGPPSGRPGPGPEASPPESGRPADWWNVGRTAVINGCSIFL